uniref:hypothetical protein n=1 Tax=Escherichia coli TaxID=562 RepID=UPI0020185723
NGSVKVTRTDLHRCYSPISFTVIRKVEGALHVKNIPEPPPPEPVTRPMELYINGELVSKWDE